MPTYSYAYDEMYDPPFPVVTVQIVSPESREATEQVQAIVDSGADGTMVPVGLLEEIGALSIGHATMAGIRGERRRVNLYFVRLEIGPYVLPGVRVAGVPEEVGFVLGRNALNQMEITLNGPAHMLEMSG